MIESRLRARHVAAGLTVLVLLVGCTSREQAGRDAVADSAEAVELATSVGVEVSDSTARMVLHVTNPSNRPITLEFSSGQRYDFAVRTPEGLDLWRWSADRMFTQALGTETIAPGATLQFTESWNFGERTGSYVAVAELTATNHRVAESAPFQIRR
jgi:hypothetical protein